MSNLVKQWDGEMIDRRFVDRRNPQDFVRGVADRMALPYTRPEPPDVFLADDIELENGDSIYTEDGGVLFEEGAIVSL